MGIDWEDLAERMENDEESAFTEFARLFVVRVLAFLCGRGVRRPDADGLAITCVSEIVQSVRRGGFKSQGTGSFWRWAFRIVRNQLSDYWRERNPLKAVAISDDGFCWVNDEGNVELAAALAEALEQLDETSRQVLILHHFDGLDFKEIGETLGMLGDTVRVRHFRALKRLEQMLPSSPAIQCWLRQLRPGRAEDQGPTQTRPESTD